MLNEIEEKKHTEEFIKQLPKGVFLTVKNGDKINTMTIGWANIGVIWGKPVLTVAVRYSRYTYELMEKSGEFTVSVPLNGGFKNELAYCGTKSGRDVDKFKECNLTAKDSKFLSTPLIGECELYYECKVVYKQAMEPALLDESIKERFYTNKDYHVLYYGEILAQYEECKS